MKVLGLVCNKCNTYIFSRAHHDCRFCICGDCMIDGGQGFGYMRYTKNNHAHLAWAEVKQSKDKLENDWNEGKDKYGLLSVDKVKFTSPPNLNTKGGE